MPKTISSNPTTYPFWLQGHISSHQPMSHLLQYFVASQARGYLELRHAIYDKIEIYFGAGKVQHCLLAKLEGEQALKEALQLRQGEFRVWRDVPTPRQSIYRELDTILFDMHIKDIHTFLGPESLLQANAQAIDETISISLQDIMVLRRLDSLRPLAEVAQELQLEEEKLSAIVERLLALGLIHHQPAPEQYFSIDFLEKLQGLCRNFLGPMSEVVLEEALDTLGCQTNTILLTQQKILAKLLVEPLSKKEGKKFMQGYKRIVQQYIPKPSS